MLHSHSTTATPASPVSKPIVEIILFSFTRPSVSANNPLPAVCQISRAFSDLPSLLNCHSFIIYDDYESGRGACVETTSSRSPLHTLQALACLSYPCRFSPCAEFCMHTYAHIPIQGKHTQ